MWIKKMNLVVDILLFGFTIQYWHTVKEKEYHFKVETNLSILIWQEHLCTRHRAFHMIHNFHFYP